MGVSVGVSAADLGQHGIEHLRDELLLGLGQLGHGLNLLLQPGRRAALAAAQLAGCSTRATRHRLLRCASKHLLRLFITGALAALPLAATLAIFAWAASLLFRWLGPDSLVGSALVALGLGVTGSEVVGYLIGVGLVLLAVLMLGLLVEAGLQRGMARLVNGVVRRIPLVSQVYDMANKLVGLMRQRDPGAGRGMRAVWCHFGGRNGNDTAGAAVLGLQTCSDVLLVDGRRCLVVLVPTAPVPVGGGLLFVPEDWVQAAELSVEAVTSLYVSMGVTAGQYLPLAKPQNRARAAQPIDDPTAPPS